MDGVGLNAVLKITGILFEIPPNIPPQLLVTVLTSQFSITNGSLFSLPKRLDDSNPMPNSIPFTAGIPKT